MDAKVVEFDPDLAEILKRIKAYTPTLADFMQVGPGLGISDLKVPEDRESLQGSLEVAPP